MSLNQSKTPLVIAFFGALLFHAALLPIALLGFGQGRAAQPMDWSAQSIAAPDRAKAGDTISLDVALSYTGPTDYRHTGGYRLYLSRDGQTDGAEILHDAVAVPHMMLKHNAVPLTETDGPSPWVFEGNQSVTLPIEADGPYWLVLEASAGMLHASDEIDISNNTRATPIYIDGPQRPELHTDTLNAPSQAVLGGTILIDYRVTNIGEGWAAAPIGETWRDAIALSRDAQLGSDDMLLRSFERRSPLGPGQTYGHERVALTLPRGEAGRAYLVLTADADQRLDQSSFTAAEAHREIELIDTRRPDLAIASIFSPQVIVLGQAFPLRWTTINLGSVATDGPWADHIYLSRDAVLDEADERIALQDATDALRPGERRESPPMQVTLPLPESEEEAEALAGPWFLIVAADGGDTLDEAIFEDNNTFALPVTLVTPDEDEDPLGDPDDPIRTEVAWIKREAVREHMARLTETIQPALQAQADPVPDAPLNPEPQPPALPSVALQPQGGGQPNAEQPTPDPQDRARPLPPMPDAPETDVAPRPQAPNARPPREVEGLPSEDGDIPMEIEGRDTPDPSEEATDTPHPDDAQPDDALPGEERVETDADPDAPITDRETDSETPAEEVRETDESNPDDNDSDRPSEVMDTDDPEQPSENVEPTDPSEMDDQGEGERETDPEDSEPEPDETEPNDAEGRPQTPASPSEEQDPTSTPRDDAEADPTDNEPERLRLEHGNVLVGQGVRITTARLPSGGVGTELTAIPRDTRVRIVFNNKGEVVDALVLGEGTGYPDWDSRLIESLYRWKAEGPEIDAADPHYAREFEYQFGLLDRRD